VNSAMNSNVGKLLVVETDDDLQDHIASLLRDAGYDVSTDYREGMKAVLGFDPDIVVLGGDPPQQDCCDLLSQIKGSEHTRNIRVVMVSPAGPVEQTCGLDLGADDVLSLPFDPQELLSRPRTQLKNKRLADQLRAADASRTASQQVMAAVKEEQKMLRLGALAVVALLVITGLISLFFHPTESISSAADVAVLKANISGFGIKQIALEECRRAAISGGPVVVLGYPALDAILARAGAETLQSIATATKRDPKQVVEELAGRNLIRPITTQGRIGDVLSNKIVHDAQTASGGFRSPVVVVKHQMRNWRQA